MRTRTAFRILPALFIVFLAIAGVFGQDSYFRFVFMTDVHVQEKLDGGKGFEKAIEAVNGLSPRPDFVVMGGDLVKDALAVTPEKADHLFDLYSRIEKKFAMPVWRAIGNHECFGVYRQSGVEPSHPDYGKSLFKKRLGDGRTYRSFDHKGWHFVLLDGIKIANRNYYGGVDSVQLEWLKSDIAKAGKSPVVAVTHIPLATISTQILRGALVSNGSREVIGNAKSVWRAFEGADLKLVLQGHLHLVEEIDWRKIKILTGGSVCGEWWKGPHLGFPEGFVVVDVRRDQLDWKYETYGWHAVSN